jgi:hypothetical protein
MAGTQDSGLEKLAALATLGTRRAPPKDLPWPEPGIGPNGGTAEAQLLRAAAAGALYDEAGTRAGALPPSREHASFPAPGAELLPEAAGWRLARMIGGDYAMLLPEWFELARARGRVLPPHFLPLVLEHVRPEVRSDAAQVLGPAAPWLAARHPNWLAAAPVTELSDARWQEGSTPERLAALAAVRKVSTERSRAWLRTTWAADPPELRSSFLEILLPTVEPGDEEFLEMALDDKRKSVRQAAVECLARLPNSAHARRNLARLEPLMVLAAEPGKLLGMRRKRKLQIELPTAPEKAAQRDGIELKPPAARKIGERAFWLAQMVALVPPRHWCDRFHCDAQTFLQAVLATDHARELLLALTEASSRHYERGWSLLLVRTWMDDPKEIEVASQAVSRLDAAVPRAERCAIAEARLMESSSRDFDADRYYLDTLAARWTPALTQLAFARLAKLIGNDRNTYSQPRIALDNWARDCDLDAARKPAAELLGKCGDSHSWRNALERFNDILAFRDAMKQELGS